MTTVVSQAPHNEVTVETEMTTTTVTELVGEIGSGRRIVTGTGRKTGAETRTESDIVIATVMQMDDIVISTASGLFSCLQRKFHE